MMPTFPSLVATGCQWRQSRHCDNSLLLMVGPPTECTDVEINLPILFDKNHHQGHPNDHQKFTFQNQFPIKHNRLSL